MSRTGFFGPHSPYLSHPLLTDERTTAEVNRLVVALGLGSGAPVLDVGCGFGRHSLELARRGFRPTGVDPSQTMIDAARASAEAEELDIRFVVTNDPLTVVTDTGFAATDNGFAAAIAMFTTVGQVSWPGPDSDLDTDPDGTDNVSAGLLRSVRELLKPGAGFLIEVPQRDAAVAALIAEDRFGADDNRTEITRRFEPETSRVVERFEVVTDGVARRFDLSYRLFEAEELADLLNAAGFSAVSAFAGLDHLAAVVEQQGPTVPGAGHHPAELDPAAPTMVLMATA